MSKTLTASIASTDIALFLLMGASLLTLTLEVIGNPKSRPGHSEKPHIRLLAFCAILAAFLIIVEDIFGKNQLSLRPHLFINEIASVFLVINTAIAAFLGRKTLEKNQNGEIYFLILAALALAIANVCHPSLILKLIVSTAWLILMTTLSIKTTAGGKKAEIGLKLSFVTIIFILLFFFALLLLAHEQLPTNIDHIALHNRPNAIAFISLIMLALAGLSFTGVPPFHFGHVDCADGGNISIAFLLQSNSFLQGGMLLFNVKNILAKSTLDLTTQTNVLGMMLVIGFMILWLRALDQSKIRRTVAYIATSVGPLFFMSIIFGTSVLLPKLVFMLAIFSLVSLTLFALYGSLAYMDSINQPWQTWEEMSGFGRLNFWPTLSFLVALSSIAGLPGTLGYFVKLSLIAPLKNYLIFSGAIFLSVSIGAACVMRIFVFMFSKQSLSPIIGARPPLILTITSLILVALGFFPFVR